MLILGKWIVRLPQLFTITIYYMEIIHLAIVHKALTQYQKLGKAMSIQHILADFLEINFNR